MFNSARDHATSPTKLPYTKVSGDWYDKEYFSSTEKSNWEMPYDWEHFGHIFEGWAEFLARGFPEAATFLDAGCAVGLLERAFLEYNENHGFDYHIEGFDHSSYAIGHADPKASSLIQLAGIDDFSFRRFGIFPKRYDVLVALDIFGHLTEAQTTRFLKRSRRYINDCLFAVIELDEERQQWEPSHINLQNRGWWDAKLKECGWKQDQRTITKQREAMESRFTKSCKVEIFIYSADNVL